jgi:hypothetical protein
MNLHQWLIEQWESIDIARCVIEDGGRDWLQGLGKHLGEYLEATEAFATDDAIAAFDVVLADVDAAIAASIDSHNGAWLNFLIQLQDDLTYHPPWVVAEIIRQKPNLD